VARMGNSQDMFRALGLEAPPWSPTVDLDTDLGILPPIAQRWTQVGVKTRTRPRTVVSVEASRGHGYALAWDMLAMMMMMMSGTTTFRTSMSVACAVCSFSDATIIEDSF